MEKWFSVFDKQIPKGKYETLLKNGEKEGLVINLVSPEHKVVINFGVVSAVRMLDEGMVLNGLFNDEEIEVFRNKGFDNTIYQITGGEFDGFVRKICGELYDCLSFRHYIIISLNFIVEVITEWEPDIVIEKIE